MHAQALALASPPANTLPQTVPPPRIDYDGHLFGPDCLSWLVHTTLDGKADVAIPQTTRIYLYASAQYGPAAFPPVRRGTQNLPNPNPYNWSHRALLRAMDAWVKDGKEPPPSQYPQLARHQLVPPAELNFPKIPGTPPGL